MEIKFRIIERKFSSNVIEKGTKTLDQNGKEKWSWEVYIVPTCKKEEGDKICRMFNPLMNMTFKKQENIYEIF